MNEDGHYEATTTHMPGREGQPGNGRKALGQPMEQPSVLSACSSPHQPLLTSTEFSVNPKFLRAPRGTRAVTRIPLPSRTNNKQQEAPW